MTNNKNQHMMKKLLIALASLAMMLSGTQAFAQGKYGADSAECIKYLSYYSEYYKSKSYDEAIPNWREAFRLCPPQANQNMLINGAVLIRRLITQNARNQEYKNALLDTLVLVHNLRAQYYPAYATTARNNKGVDLHNYADKNDVQRLYDEYNSIIEANKAETNASLLVFDLNAAVDLYKEGKIGAEDVINIYQRNIELIDKIPAKTDADKEKNNQVRTDLESLFISSKVASCENLLELFGPRYAAAPEDLELAKNIVRMMSLTEGCTDNDLFLNAATTMYKLDPSANSAYFLFRLNSSRGNYLDAVHYMEEAINSEDTDAETDAQYYYELATFCYKSGQLAKAFESAREAADNPGQAARAYFLMGTIWGNVKCGGDEIASRAPYWVAVDYLNRAKAADESLAEEANRMIGQFARYYPKAADAFMYDLTDGQSYTVSCSGMRATTTVRTQK